MEQVAISFAKMPRGIDKDVDKEDIHIHIHIYNEIFFSHIKE